MVSLRLSSSERLAKDSICSISKSPSLRHEKSARKASRPGKFKLIC
ncbi:hypothetical protein KTP63_02125 [Klebsiella quasipneumoniae]|nr:hypothetical protein [Klebsiella quasipneumoniae]HBR1027440.1 hypothetical protein [Klebsiella quasipneumoniae subsp. similipneumoniae]MBV0142667.1 hypothetical protein [Klebsiella quasipneumoniae]MCT7319572.1 hypothetical protein [Klebsiella quasipneumoniae]MDP1256344.1 hypothetical protein [Klebsiella quasipneumoniae]QLP57874.1 hypothetical protein HV092_10535 [Klebsiella quasipneumoniae]